MSSVEILDGKRIAETVKQEVRLEVDAFQSMYGRPPGLDVILVGENPASQIYTRNKEKASLEVGIKGRRHLLEASLSQEELLARIEALNADPTVDGILVQLPLPPHISKEAVISAISPWKDVDGFHPFNVGLLALGRARLVPCTPLACMRLLAEAKIHLRGIDAVVLGRSVIVGKPVAQLLLAAHATVTIAHSRTAHLLHLCRRADLVLAAVGQPELVRGDWLKEGAVVIDVGINRVKTADGDARIVGDVCFEEAKERVRAITPVPGGVGPITIACLLKNTLRAARERLKAERATLSSN
ncbi:bifunctional methylenetetrahydrofolate dehydrogenase/methenyltetrahydrofolate cyclohydrolase FolD [Pajaroellobacter abortibovis]|uniref:Bifunctional protein FolD n=1 Tax=Pajaroellobacter abortibovis TaxID=1882918 RepID=A0A1L6MVS3_9BACT|nr:bifunctional methylenetetrahydrofolate dehydrogenase/methenyltetrahydrofolate cyclohydrolase FolD [Pajaroellobacter abortibovis]APR99639.1 bifunctional methylenetetrahydrofolate dehydrogenase/methenyltetrahydrofolate cyclohydrolase [Pajaroellobacter abortibovis]